MKARGYLVRLRASELDETFIGLQLLVTTSRDAAVGGVSDVFQCTPETGPCGCELARWLYGPTHTHLWLAGDHYFLRSDMNVVTSPPECALEHAPHL